MGFKLRKGRLTYKSKAGMMKGYVAEPCNETKEKGKSYIKKFKNKK